VEKLAILAVLALMVSTLSWWAALQYRHKQEKRSMRDYLNRISPTNR
jgi:hypothetical protein